MALTSIHPRAKCSVCRLWWRLRKNGTLMKHHLFSGQDRYEEPCEGSGKKPRVEPDQS